LSREKLTGLSCRQDNPCVDTPNGAQTFVAGSGFFPPVPDIARFNAVMSAPRVTVMALMRRGWSQLEASSGGIAIQD
jgi:hypothetical protein